MRWKAEERNKWPRLVRTPVWVSIAVIAGLLSGCGGGAAKKEYKEFFTSGSQEADQRASQRMAKAEQLSGSGEGKGEKDVKKAKPEKAESGGETNKAAKAEKKMSLYERLGGEAGLVKIVEDMTPRVLQDPRVNWGRRGVTKGGLFSIHSGDKVTWSESPENVAQLKKHMVQFLALATGGPAHYDGKEMKAAHADMHISNPEFDAVIGDLKATLDRLQIPNQEQKELLAIFESTRPQIVTER